MNNTEYLQQLTILDRRLKKTGEHLKTPNIGFMPTFVEVIKDKCEFCDKRLHGWTTLLYGYPNTITCKNCNNQMKTRWIRVDDKYEGPEIINTIAKDPKHDIITLNDEPPTGTLRDIQ